MATKVLSARGTKGPVGPDRTDQQVQDTIDRWLISGALLAGSLVGAIPGLLMLVKGYGLTKRAQREGRAVRPDIITIIGLVCLVDASLNWLMWGWDLFPVHDLAPIKTLYNGFGRLWDGGYYLGHNTTALGGTGVVSEKSWEVASILVMYPMRIVAG